VLRVALFGDGSAGCGADGRQVRYLVVRPKREDLITDIELVEGDFTAPVVMAVTVEGP